MFYLVLKTFYGYHKCIQPSAKYSYILLNHATLYQHETGMVNNEIINSSLAIPYHRIYTGIILWKAQLSSRGYLYYPYIGSVRNPQFLSRFSGQAVRLVRKLRMHISKLRFFWLRKPLTWTFLIRHMCFRASTNEGRVIRIYNCNGKLIIDY